jgi:Leucine rich repeat
LISDEVGCNYYSFDVNNVSYYACGVKHLDDADKIVTGISSALSGDHMPGMSNDDVTAIDFYYQNTPTIPKGFDKIFPNLKQIDLNKSGLKSLTAEDLKPYPGLEMVFIRNNPDLLSVDNDLFVNNPAIKYVDFSDNKNLVLPQDVFKSLPNLVEVFLNGEPCAYMQNQDPELQSKLNRACDPDSRFATSVAPTIETATPETTTETSTTVYICKFWKFLL